MGLKDYKVKDELYYKFPKRVQDTIEVREINKNGVFKVGKMRFSKTYLFFDVNYALASDSEQEAMLRRYCDLLNSLGVTFQITINNKNRNMEVVNEQTLFSLKNDGYDEYREIYNDIMRQRIIEGKNGIEQQKYFTISVVKKTFKEAQAQFNLLETTLKKAFMEMGTAIVPLDTVERMRILHDFYRIGSEEIFAFDYEEFKKEDKDVIDYICPDMIDFKQSHFTMGDKYCRALFIKDYGSSVSDKLLTSIMELPGHMMITVTGTPIPRDVARQAVRRIYNKIELDIQKEQSSHNKQGHFTTDISYGKRTEKQDTEELLNDMRDNDEQLFWVGTTLLLVCDSKEELELLTKSVMSIGSGEGCQITKHHFRQREALNTTLPLGVVQTEAMRVMQSTSISGLVPFNIQEIYQPSGVYYGVNQQSKNIIKADRRKLQNGNGFVLATSGGGKSMFCKDEITKIYLNTEDDIIIIDPENEYGDICEAFRGQNITIAAETENYINPFEMYGSRSKKDFANKVEFVLCICEQCINTELTPTQKSIVNKVMNRIYAGYLKGKTDASPTMVDFYHGLQDYDHEVAGDLALQLDIFVEGALNIFSHGSNVNFQNRLTVFNIQELGEQLSAIGTFIMLENITTKIEQNKKAGKGTWLYIDEIHLLVAKEYSAFYLFKLWKRIRKNNGFVTGITQNVEDTLQSYRTRVMLSNSEFIVLLKQSENDITAMDGVIDISDAQLKYVSNNSPGTGLIKFGSVVVPFDNKLDTKTKLYKLFNTDPKSAADIAVGG